MRTYELFIDGAWTPASSDDHLTVINPATEERIGEVAQASTSDVVRAIAAARRAFDEGPWPRMAPAERARYLAAFHAALVRRKEELVDLVVTEAGSTRMVADFLQVQTPLDHLAWWAERAASFPYMEPLPPVTGMGLGQGVILKEPVGVVAAITPFNFPIFLNLWKLGPALAMGNTVVLKPSPYTPLEAFVLAEVLAEIGLPPGVVNVVTGDAAAGAELTTNPGVDLISFTGSDVVGRKVMEQASGGLKKVLLELGGKSPNIIFGGADLDRLLPMAVMGFTIHCGQGCALTTRILVQRSMHDELVERMRAFLGFFSVGDPSDPSVMMGPLIREEQRARVERFVASGIEAGAEVAFGGGRPAGVDRGFFVEPTLFTGVENSMEIAQEEIFGPVGVVIPFDSEDDAIRIANDTRYGLGGGIWHPDPARAFELARQIRTGMVTINGGGGGFTPFGTFGGYKHSGIGRELGDHGLHEYVELKTVAWPVG